MSEHFENRKNEVALRRFAAVSFIEQKVREGFGVVQALRLAALRPWPYENGRYASVRTLEDYWYAWKSGGFAALQPKSRDDEGTFRKFVLGTSARKPPLSDTFLWDTLSLAHPFKIEVILSKRVDVLPKQGGREAQNIVVDPSITWPSARSWPTIGSMCSVFQATTALCKTDKQLNVWI